MAYFISFSHVWKKRLFHIFGVVIGAFLLSLDTEGVGVGSSTINKIAKGGGEVMDDTAFNFFLAIFASDTVETRCLCIRLI